MPQERSPRTTKDPLDEVRARIDALDEELVRLVAQRVRLGGDAARVKAATGLPHLDPGREAAVVRRAAAMAQQEGLDPEGVRHLFWNLVGLTRRSHEGARDTRGVAR